MKNANSPARRPRRPRIKDQEREGFSIPSQLKLLRHYAREQHLTIVREFVDVETAKHSGRGGFGEMIAALNADPFCRTILVEKTDRLYRNIKDWMTVDDLDVTIHFVKENAVVSKDSRSSDKFLHGIKVLMAKNYGDFRWHGRMYHGSHDPLISRDTFAAVQAVLNRKPRARYPKQRHAFMGLLTCARCGCAMTAERKKGKYTYYRCTAFHGRCGNAYIGEERLADSVGAKIRGVGNGARNGHSRTQRVGSAGDGVRRNG